MYVKVTNGIAEAYKVSQLRKDYPHVSFPSVISNSLLAQYSIYPVVEAPLPVYDPKTQKVSDYYEQNEQGIWERRWAVENKLEEEIVPRLIEKAAKDRYRKETEGILWTDSLGDVWEINTSLESQSKITGAVTAVLKGIRVENSVWKCEKIVGEDQILMFRPTTNAEIEEWGSLVHLHVQKCFTAESNLVEKIRMGDYTSDFETEFLVL